MVLTDKQRGELHNAIYEYLSSLTTGSDGEVDFSKTLSAFKEEASIQSMTENENENGASSHSIPLLEKKWTSVVRLQRKILSLETELSQVKQELILKGKGSSAGAGLSSLSSKDGSFILSSTAKNTLKGHRSPITCTVFHPVYNLLVSTSEDGTVKVWDYETGDFERTLKGHTNSVQCAAFDLKGQILATCSSDLSIKLWDFTTTYECTKTLMGHDHNVTGVAFMPDTAFLVSCSRDKTLRVWDTNNGYCVRTLTGHTEWVRKLAVCQVNSLNLVASCSSDHTIIVWDITTGNQMSQMRGHEHVVECLDFSSAAADKNLKRHGTTPTEGLSNGNGVTASTTKSTGGMHLVSGSRDKSIRIWDVHTGNCLITLNGHDSWVRAVLFQPNGKYVISASEDKSIKMWDLKDKRCIKTIQAAHSHFITCLSSHSSLPLLASGSVDTNIKLWVAS